MDDRRTDREDGSIASLERYIQMFRDGIFCHAELWCGIADRIGSANVMETLGELRDDTQADLRRFYRERPWSLGSAIAEGSAPPSLEKWCWQDQGNN
jgi:hypothetical protein